VAASRSFRVRFCVTETTTHKPMKAKMFLAICDA
jgi:hypothetical protein